MGLVDALQGVEVLHLELLQEITYGRPAALVAGLSGEPVDVLLREGASAPRVPGVIRPGCRVACVRGVLPLNAAWFAQCFLLLQSHHPALTVAG